MKEPSAARKRTLALHERALRFSHSVNDCCPTTFTSVPSSVVWKQLVRAADGASNNLIEADAASSEADFLNKMSIALRETKEARAALLKIRVSRLDRFKDVNDRAIESEADQLSRIFATIIVNMRIRLDEEAKRRALLKNSR